MKLQIKQINPNPYRDMDRLPISTIKVEQLVGSIEQTGFWDNILARPKPGEKDVYELAYGHHRLEALKQAGYTEIDIPVKDLDDSTMIQIMLNENMQEWNITISVINESVRVAKDYIDSELRKYESWEELKRTGGTTSMLFKTWDFKSEPELWQRLKTRGVGKETLEIFMGKPWKGYQIREGLANYHTATIDKTAVESLQMTDRSSAFRKAVQKHEKDTGQPVTPERQKEVAEIVRQKIESKEMPKHVSRVRDKIATVVEQELAEKTEYDIALESIQGELRYIENNAKNLAGRMRELSGRLSDMGVDNISSINSLVTIDTFSDLHGSMLRLAEYLGIKFNN